jgi:hypothetical protein
MEGIRLVEALEQMETAQEPFTLRFVKVDRRRKTGGQIVEWQNCRLSGPRRGSSRHLAEQAARSAGPDGGRQHYHYRNGTRNIVVGNGTQRRKIHIWLLLSLNGKKIVL